jgi:hypothetical protein
VLLSLMRHILASLLGSMTFQAATSLLAVPLRLLLVVSLLIGDQSTFKLSKSSATVDDANYNYHRKLDSPSGRGATCTCVHVISNVVPMRDQNHDSLAVSDELFLIIPSTCELV